MDGQRVTIDSGGHHIEGEITTSAARQYLLKDEGVSLGTFSGDAFVTMLPGQAIQAMRATILVDDTEESRQGIKEAMALVRESRIPVVNFTGASLQVVKHTYLGMEVHDGTGIPIYYVTDFKITKSHYLE